MLCSEGVVGWMMDAVFRGCWWVDEMSFVNRCWWVDWATEQLC